MATATALAVLVALAAAPTTTAASSPPPPPWVPAYTGPQLDASKPLGGLAPVAGATHTPIFMANDTRSYNHAAMIDYHGFRFLVAWKMGYQSEDKSGQYVAFSLSSDGVAWTPPQTLFPNMTTPQREAALFVGPPIHINGRQYVGASPGEPTDAAAGAQFCLWPDPLDPRNCGPPGHKQAKGTLLMRQVLPGDMGLGPVFWAHNYVPSDWAEASTQLGFKTIADMDAQTQADIATLGPQEPSLPCGPMFDATYKCEACRGGCQLWDSISKANQSYIGNERSHYMMPPTSVGAASGGDRSGGAAAVNASAVQDVILYRSGKVPFLWASTRSTPSQDAWSDARLTNISNDESNLNTGTLPDGRVYLVSNAVFRPKNGTTETLRHRDPVTLLTSTDGIHFDTAVSVMSCTQFGPTSTCTTRLPGSGKNTGPSYPQGLTVVDPAPQEHQGFYVVATNNKEDVWLAKLPFGAF